MRLIYVGVISMAAAVQLAGCAKGDDAVGGSGGGGAVGGFGGFGAADGGGAVGGTDGGGTGGFDGFAGTAGTGNTGNTGGSGATGGGSCTPPVSGGTCDTFPQCGCAAGQACDVVALTGVTGCVTEGTVQPYAKCDGSSAFCTAGYACVGTACKQFCEQNTDCTSGSCINVVDSNQQPIPGMKVCRAGCALENPGAVCGAGLGCYANNDTPPVTDCAKAGTGTGAGDCSGATEVDPTLCKPSYGCVLPDPNSNATGDCRKWCRVGFTTDCPGLTCKGFNPPFFVDGLEYGVCL